MTHSLTPHEQQQVDTACKDLLPKGRVYAFNLGWEDGFNDGITFALDHLFAGRMETFAEWIRTFEALERQNGQWVIESQLSDKQIVRAFIEDLKQKEDGK